LLVSSMFFGQIKTILGITIDWRSHKHHYTKLQIKNSHWMVLFQNYVRQSRSPTKMAATVQLRCYWKPLWSRWAITGSLEPLVFVGTAILVGERDCRT
jgi:hypothetical protein